MALIQCPECGREISDKAASCPGCGCPASEFQNQKQEVQQEQEFAEDNRSEEEKLIDECFWRCPRYTADSARALSKATGMPLGKSRKIMREKYKAYEKERKAGKHPDRCPICGSQLKEEYVKPGSASTSKIDLFGEHYMTTTRPSEVRIRCGYCGLDLYAKPKTF